MPHPSEPRTTSSGSRFIRASHAVLGVAAVLQILVAEWMSPPWDEDGANTLGPALFEVHEIGGILAGCALVCLLAGLMLREGRSTGVVFFPWMFAGGRSVLRNEWRRLFEHLRRLSFPHPDDISTIARAWAGFGLISIAWLVTTGSIVLLVGMTPEPESWAELHEIGAFPIQLYLAGHIGAAVLHELRGEGVLRRMWRPAATRTR